MITRGQYLFFMARALYGMAGIVEELGDDLANRKLPFPGANSPYAVLNHCLGAIEYWVGDVVAGRRVHRDRDAEFQASGQVGPLVARVRATVELLAKDVGNAYVRRSIGVPVPGLHDESDQGAALFHVYTDVVQHHGQMEIMRDAIIYENEKRENYV
ncbi:mycothiol transferase [Kibdelosporangium aridum]|uniref:DinB family protein n=1 Tax=Kibdelosporangium aridum TaxID=2030 RepID=A0A1Y5Y596_KIBAR|nr:DUF664 domain-containing protein [Kibdelosporangium aridum]SMD24573.1 Protein of unknown function [Kibdelosporangium aridum]